jgi:predicted phosphodiesterase
MARFNKSDVAREYVTKFPKTSKAALARMLLRDHPTLWNSIEHARGAVNTVTGTNGGRHRLKTAHKELFRPGTEGNGMPELPEGITSFRDWAPVPIKGETRTLILADLHIPYHVKSCVELAIQYGKDRNPTHIIINGDGSDFFSVSFWEKDPRKRNLKNEIDMVRQFLDFLRVTFPEAEIIFKVGNHEERWERYLAVKAPELLGVEDFELQKIFRLRKNRIKLIEDMRPIKLGQLYIVHGHEFKWGITNPVNPARGFYLRAQEHCLGSHLHRTSSHSETSLSGEVTSTWSTGCLCDLHPDYSPINKWNHGFAYVETDTKGLFNVDNRKIIDGAIYKD